MKKLFLFIMIAMIGITVSAADMTQEQYLAKRKAYAATKGTPYNEATSIQLFKRYDTNKDGVLSDEEWAAASAKAKPAKAKPAKAAENE